MSSLIIGLMLIVPAVFNLPAGTELQYTGTLLQQTKTGPREAKTFSIYAVSLPCGDSATHLAWSLDEQGDGWSWPERFGLLLSGSSNTERSRSLQLLHTHDGKQYPLPLRSPLFEFREKLSAQASWNDGLVEYSVSGKRTVNDRECWIVNVDSRLGRSQSLAVDAATGILVTLDEKLFMGQGDEFQLKIELQFQRTQSASDLENSHVVFDSLHQIQLSLTRSGDQKNVELTAEQLKSSQSTIGKIQKMSEATPWSRLTAVISKDLIQQELRLEGAHALAKKFVGQPAPPFSLQLPNGSHIPPAELQDKVVVLHFWEYRGEALVEPYGQIGYLDFLNNKRSKRGVKVVGINVDGRFAGGDKSKAATLSLKKIQEFMNLGYDVAVDDGTILTQFGDPPSLGSPLPLWVVIGRDGAVVDYHIGFYKIRPDEGLKQLDDAVVEALRRRGRP